MAHWSPVSAAERRARRGRWDALQAELERAGQWPAPEVRMRELADVDPLVSRGVRIVGAAAVAGGWTVRLTYARGTWGHASRGTPLKVVDSIAARMEYPGSGCRAVAVWLDRSFESALWLDAEKFEKISRDLLLERLAGMQGSG